MSGRVRRQVWLARLNPNPYGNNRARRGGFKRRYWGHVR